ncbi:unnamed protein product [Hydatigera taeniaeformis]|uniref:Non-specific serine/threonine protein kinase n=1 Tax=Hydatigena taeniaeformis TaxID=6205 RepID=A0A0R3WPB3_HYDTA|nr:unnamed protein product [Hydatigera taeniaeformis]
MDFGAIKGVLRSLREYIQTNPSLTTTDEAFALISEMADRVCETLGKIDARLNFEEVCGLICTIAGLELSLMRDRRPGQSLELEKRRICSSKEFCDRYRLKLLGRVISDRMRSSFVFEVTRTITEACTSTRLATASRTFSFSRNAASNGSVQFVLLYMRYFASASFGKFLTPDVSVTNEFADRTQAIIATACTAWLSTVGAAVGLATSGLLLSSVKLPSFVPISVAHLCEIVLDKLLPTILAFVMSSDTNDGESFTDIVLALFNPLINFFSGATENGSLAHQIVDIMVVRGNLVCGSDVQKHLKRMSSAITDLLVFRTLCDILCSVLQDTNLTIVNGKSSNAVDFLEEIVFTLTQFGKQFDSIIRQLADRIAEVAVQHSKIICIDTSSYQPVEKLLRALSIGEIDLASSADRRPEVGLSEWSFFMNELWKLFCATCPAGLARQMYTRVAAETLLHIVHVVANSTTKSGDEIKNMARLLYFFFLLRVHSKGFFSELKNGSFSMSFEPSNWLKIVDPRRFRQSSKEAQELLVMFRHFGSNPYFDPVTALKLTFFDDGELLKPLLHSSLWVNSEQSCPDRESIFAVYKACFELFAIADFKNNCYGNILAPLFESKDIGALAIESSSPYLVWFEAFIDFIADLMQPKMLRSAIKTKLIHL